MKKPIIISITNNKGGVGKTTSAVNTSAALALHHQEPVLLIDFDTQANSTRSLVGDHEGLGILSVLVDNTLGMHNVFKETKVDNLFLVPNEARFEGKKIEMSRLLQFDLDPNYALKRQLDTDFVKEFSYIIIDCSPSIDIGVVNALMVSDFYIIPTLADDLSIMGIEEILHFGNQVSQINDKLTLLGIFLNNVNRSRKQTKKARDLIIEAVGDLKLETEIPTFAKFTGLPSNQKTIFDIVAPSRKGAKEYISLADEIVERIKRHYSNKRKEINFVNTDMRV